MRILVVAGPNGAGKTTFARRYLKRDGDQRRFVNGDEIAARLRPDDPAAAAPRAKEGTTFPKPSSADASSGAGGTSAISTGGLWTNGRCTTIPVRFRSFWRSPRNGTRSVSRVRSGNHRAQRSEPQMAEGNK